ncbi:MAG: hypothetical protein U9R10_02980 [Euryarchaeota archaeon]|nr:hypothetical protein [Euryarchaeota archaeon]
MELIFSDYAKKELENLPQDLKTVYLKHLVKIESMSPRKHMKHSIPFHVENVTKPARLIYDLKGDETYIPHCFKNNKEYERWYKSYK